MKVDIYDFDGTIYDGDSGVDLVLFAIEKNPKVFWYLFCSLGVVVLYLMKLKSKEEMKSKLFSFLKVFDNVEELVSEFWVKHERKLKKFWINKKNHSKDIIISASGYFWLKPIADKYKVKDLFATDINMVTGEVKGVNCHGKEKVKLLYDKYPKVIVRKMYTDSVNDLPLIEIANEGYLVRKNKLYNYYDYKPNFIVRFWRFGWKIYHKNEEVWNYLIVGGLTTVVSLCVKYGLLFTVLNASNALQLQIAVVASWVCAVIFAYFANRIYVFHSKSKEYLKEITSFVGGRVATLLMEMFIMWFFVTLLGLNSNLWVVVFTLVAQILVMVGNYILSKLFVFKK